MAADTALVTFLTDTYSRGEISKIYLEAGLAYTARLQEVTITAHSLGGGSSSGVISGNPRDLMIAAKAAMNEIDGTADTGGYAVHQDFSTRRFES